MPKSAAEATPPTGNRFVEFDEFIDYQLTKASKSIQSTDILVGVVGAGLGLTLYLFIFILADHWLVTGGLGPWARAIYWGLGFGALGYWVATRVVKPLNGRVNSLYVARQIEKSQPGLKSSLLVLTDLKQAGRATSGPIRGSLEKRAAVGLSKADVEEAVDRSTLMTSSYALLFLLAVFCGYALLSPKSILQSAWRAFVPFTSTGVATRTRIDHVNPGSTEVPALSHLDVEVEVSGNAPPEATLYFTTADGAFVDEALPLRDTGEGLRRYRGTLIGPDGRGLRQNLTYHVVAGDARSDNYLVTVIQSPSAVVDSVDYEYQPYTGLANKSEPGGAIDAWEGTRVTVHATANQKVKSATLLFSDTEDTSVKAEEQPMIITEGTKLKATWQLAFRTKDHSFPKFYRVQLETEEGHKDPLPTLHPLNIRADLPPKVEVLHPKSDIQAPVNGVVGIAYRASDPDFKLRSLILNLEHDGQVLVTSPRLFTGPPDEESREGTHTLRLKEFNLAAGSRLTYWIEARDNFEPFGERSPNRTVTPRLNIDLVDPQPPAKAAEQEKQAEGQAQEALKESQPDQGKPMGAENAGDERTQGDEKGSDSKPAEDGKKQDGQAERPGEQGDPNKQNTESGRPGEQASPMPGDRAQDQNQDPKPAGTEQQPGTGDKSGQKQPGEPGEGQDKTEPGDSKPGADQRSNSGKRDGEKGAPGQDPSQGQQQSGKRDKAPDDTALKKLMEWNQKQQEREQQQKQSEQASPSKPNDSKPNEERGAPGEKSPEGQSSQNKTSGNETSDPANPMKGQDKGKSAQSPEDRGPKGNDPSKDDATKGGETKQNGEPGKPSGEPMQNSSSTGDKPGADDQKPGKTGNEESPSKPQAKGTEPGNSDASKVNKPGESNAEPADSKTPGEPGSKPNESQELGDKKGQPTADQAENPAQSPMDKQGKGGEKAASPQNQDQKPGANDSPSKGQETPTGQSGERTQPPVEKTQSQQKSGNSTDKPAGQSDEQGTREKGNGDPGSSKPGEGAGQKSPGEGEPGKDGQKSASGEKSGAAKSDDGNKSSQPGSKPGSEASSDSASKPQQDGGKSGDPSQDGKSDSEKGGDQQGGDQKGGDQQGGDQKGGDEKGGDEKGGDEKGGDEKGGDQKGGDQKGGDQKGGDQKGGDQKGGDQKGGDQKGGDQKGGDQGGDKPGDKPGDQKSQAGSKPGMGVGGGASPGSQVGEGTPGEGLDSAFKPDAPNLENRKKATNLALKRLQETLERGEIDPELQKELGFTDEELRAFMDRLQERLADNGDDNSPEAQARRRQFEQLLKGINLQTETGKREGGEGTAPAGTGFSSAKRNTPAEYKAAEQRYRESLNRKK